MNTAINGVREFLQCPECTSTRIAVAYLDKRNRHPDQQRCTCTSCGYAGRRWRFRQFQPVRINGERTA